MFQLQPVIIFGLIIIKEPKSKVFNCVAVFASSLELIACSCHQLTPKAYVSFNSSSTVAFPVV